MPSIPQASEDDAADERGAARGVPAASHERDADCLRSIEAFVAQRLTAEEFHGGFCDLTGGTLADPDLVGVLRTVRALCDAYANGLPSGAGYRVSAEQFRSEVCHLSSTTPSIQDSDAPCPR